MITAITLAVVPGSEADAKLLDAARSGKPEPLNLKAEDGLRIWTKCIVHGPTTRLAEDGSSVNEYILEALQNGRRPVEEE